MNSVKDHGLITETVVSLLMFVLLLPTSFLVLYSAHTSHVEARTSRTVQRHIDALLLPADKDDCVDARLEESGEDNGELSEDYHPCRVQPDGDASSFTISDRESLLFKKTECPEIQSTLNPPPQCVSILDGAFVFTVTDCYTQPPIREGAELNLWFPKRTVTVQNTSLATTKTEVSISRKATTTAPKNVCPVIREV